MQFISNDKIDSVFKTLLNKDFNVDNISTINNMKFNGDKIKYGYVSKFIKDIDPDKRDILLTNTELCIKLSDMLEFNDTFMQILNHIILEVPRATELDFVKEQTQRYSQQNRDFRKMQREFSVKIEDFGNEFEKIKEEFNRFENRIGNIQNEFIGILSIFSAIIIAFFGGIQVLGQVISSIKDANFYLLVMVTIIIGLVLFNIIYMLLYTVSKIITKNIGINIYKCESCYNANKLKCLINKYPIVFWYNSISMILFIFIFSIFNLDKYLVLKYIFNSFIWMMTNKKYINLIIIFTLLILLVFIFNKFIFTNIKDKFSKISCIISNQNVSQVIENNNEVDTYQVEVAITKNT